MKKNRGNLTLEMESMGETFFGKKLTQEELRLLPYIDYLCKNFGGIDPSKINEDERVIFSAWKKRGFIDYSSSPTNGYCCIRQDFFEFMNKILWLAYVDQLDA